MCLRMQYSLSEVFSDHFPYMSLPDPVLELEPCRLRGEENGCVSLEYFITGEHFPTAPRKGDRQPPTGVLLHAKDIKSISPG